MKTIHQTKNQYAYKHNGKGFTRDGKYVGDTLKDVLLSNGGLCKIEGGAKQVILQNVGSVGEVHGGGVYFAITANKPVGYFEWNNIAQPNWWIRSSSGTKKGEMPGEAALRIMGKAGKALIFGVNFRCGTWIDNTGKKTWWKQSVQIRDIGDILFSACKFIGPVELGRQKDPSGVNQYVGLATFAGCGFTQLPSVSVKGSVGKIVYKGCYFIDENGKPTGKKVENKA
jgi:hypothetical protein